MSAEPLNVCVLGGTGFVGTALVNRLTQQGHWVRVPTRNRTHGEPLRVLPTVELVEANVHDPGTLDRLVDGMDAVINLIGILNEHGRVTFQSAHVALAEKLVAALKAARVRRLVQMSALGAAAQAPSRYLRSKAGAEAHIRAAAAHLDYTIFRPSVIFGPGDSLTRRFAGLLRLSAGFLPLARTQARFTPVYVGDVADAFVRAVGGPKTFGQTYPLGGPEVMTLEQIVRLTAQVAGLPCRILRLPDALGRVQAAVLGVLPGKPLTLDNFRSLTVDSVCSGDALARLGLTAHRMMQILPGYLSPPALSSAFSRPRSN